MDGKNKAARILDYGAQITPNLSLLSGQSLYGLKAVLIIKIDLKDTANPIMENKRSQNTSRKANTATINTVRKHCFNIAFIKPLKLFSRNSQIYNNTFQAEPRNIKQPSNKLRSSLKLESILQ